MEAHRDGTVCPGIVELIAAVGRKHELYPKSLGCFTEHADLISSRRRD
jgi:hypothetical protein